ncbi:MAG: hypoxanthine phosphoribosyltransferase [Taibaiella sp.]|nr:hypoxanthine phosphoribosyltransferase [Taibaiella sp.]
MQARVSVAGHNYIPFLSEGLIAERIAELGAQLNADYEDKNPILIAVLNGSFIFAADLFRQLSVPASISFVKLASYKGTTSTGNVVTAIGLEENLNGRHVIIVEDIIDTGKTLSAFLPEIMQRGPASVKIATFLSKPDARTHPVKPDYCGFEIENKFVVGYGLDHDGQGRNLPALYILED